VGGSDSGDPHRDLAGVLHDVSNALTVLLGWLGEARAPGASPETVTYALGIVEQRARIARDLARHAIGGPRVDEQREAGAIAGEVAAALRVEAQKSGTRIVVRGEAETVKVAGALDVSQVLTNLVMNAVAHAPTGSAVDVAITVDEERCIIVVSDEGPGVASSRHQSIFEGDSLRPGGTGLGLRHSRALARAWGGDVELAAPGEYGAKGASFRITWPRADAVPRPPKNESMSPARANELAGLRVLIVEDDLAVTQLLETALDARGAAVTIAQTAAELEKALGNGPYDAALVDLSPIADDASTALQGLRGACPGAELVLITGSADKLPEAVAASGLKLVRKPFEVREVLAALARRTQGGA
jgi:CheY-like chemotaxis protein